MPRYEVDTTIEIDIDGDDEEAYEHVDRILQRAHDRDKSNPTEGATIDWHFTMVEGCVTNKTAEEDALSTASVCRYCERGIVNNPTDGWVNPEAGGEDSMWRETCESEDAPAGEHEPEEAP